MVIKSGEVRSFLPAGRPLIRTLCGVSLADGRPLLCGQKLSGFFHPLFTALFSLFFLDQSLNHMPGLGLAAHRK